MQIRPADLDAIVTAVEMLIEGTLQTVHIRHDDELVFSAHYDGAELIIDPEVMSPELAQHLLTHTSLGDSQRPAPSEPNAAAADDRSDRPERADAERPVRA